MTMKLNTYKVLAIAIIAIISVISCQTDWTDEMTPHGNYNGNPAERLENEDRRKVMLLYIAGFNNLKSYLTKNIEDLKKGWLPGPGRNNDIILVYSHMLGPDNSYLEPSSPTLTRIYTDYSGEIVADTLIIYDKNTISSSADNLKMVLNDVRERFSAQSYGLVFSSHATGYLPTGYYTSPGDYVFKEKMMYRYGRNERNSLTYAPYVEIEHAPDRPMTKSIGQDYYAGMSYEIELDDFAKAIPMKLDYILFDACLMGGIEVAYELADKCERIGFSQTEVLAQGFNYTTIATHLLHNKRTAEPEMVCKDYIDYYNSQTGVHRSATISMVDCSKLEPIAEICKELFQKYRNGINTVTPSKVQRYYTGAHKWFYDLESILKESGASQDDMERLKDAIDRCIVYKGHTPSFLGEFDIKTFSGFSMYLPRNGSSQLDLYYKTLKWNKATGLVE